MKFIDMEHSADAVLFLQNGQVKFGVLSDGTWISLSNDTVRKISHSDQIISLFPILEMERDFVQNELLQVQAKIPSTIQIKKFFPEEELLETAITKAVSDYWPEKALNWAEKDSNLIQSLEPIIHELIKKEWASQKLKHRCIKLLRVNNFM